jgi:ribosomal protein L7/L12
MINLQLTVREAMELANNCHVDIYNKIVNAFEVALGVNQFKTVTITGGMNLDNRIPCIKAIRLHSGWGLKESKEWTDYLVGGWKYDKFVPAKEGTKHSLTLSTPEAAEKLLNELVDLGCEGYLS